MDSIWVEALFSIKIRIFNVVKINRQFGVDHTRTYSRSVLGALIVITGWITLGDFDTYPEAERGKIMQRIKASPALIVLGFFMYFPLIFI